MSKRRGKSRMMLLFLVALDRFKATVVRHCRSVDKVFRSITTRDQRNRLTVDVSTDVSHPNPPDTPGQQLMDIGDVANALNIGDRIQVFCDDGFVVAEKISQTKFQLIHCQEMSRLIH